MSDSATLDTKVEDINIGPRTIRIAALVAASAIVFVFVFLFLNQSSVSEREFYQPDGYIERVQDLIDSHRLEYIPPTQESIAEQPWGRIEFVEDPEGISPEKVRLQNDFFNESRRIQEDIEQFNESGEGIFTVRKRRDRETGEMRADIRFDHSSYNFFLPYPQRPPMDSKFSFGGEELPTLGGDGIALGFTPLDETVTAADPDAIIALPLRKWFQPGPKDGGYYQALGYNLLESGTGAVINLRATKDGTVLRVFEPRRFFLFINGISVQNPKSDEGLDFVAERRKGLKANTYRLLEGDRIRIHDTNAPRDESEMIFRFGRFDGASIMQSYIENGQLISQVDPKVAQSLPFTQQIVDATNAYGAGKGLRPPNVQHTVNQTLHSILQTKLESFVRTFDSTRAGVAHTEYEPACVAVVDALNGDVLAIPSYPSPSDLETLNQRFQTGRAPAHIGESKLSRLKWNQNFPTIPIGSTTKPILATAIWDAYPELQNLTIEEPAGSAGRIFGLQLARPLTTVSRARTVDPVNFLGKSSNTYTVSLFLLTLADEDSYSISGNGRVRATNGKVDFSRHIRGDFIPNGLDSDSLRTNAKLVDCFGIDLNTDYSDRTRQFDRSFIEPLLEQLEIEKEQPLPPVFWPVTPARTVLNLQEIDVVRGELVSMLLGGNTNRWSNVKLAEAYARIGSGKKVEARLLKDRKSKEEPKFESMPNKNVLDLVHKGMTASWQSGTAVRISSAVRQEAGQITSRGMKFKFIGKTGTARRTIHECAAFAFYAEIQDSKGNPLSATATTIYLQDRADSTSGARNSAVAVEFAKQILPDLIDWMKQSKEVQKYLK